MHLFLLFPPRAQGLSAASGKLSLDASVPWLSEGGTPTVIRQFDAQLDRAALLLASGSSLATVVMDSPVSRSGPFAWCVMLTAPQVLHFRPSV